MSGFAITAKPIEWQEHGKRSQEWSENRYGFYITHDAEEDEPYYAVWGEDDGERFKTLDEAKQWCQAEIDRWVAAVAVVVPVARPPLPPLLLGLTAPWRAAAATHPEQWPLQVLDAQGQAVCFIAHSNGQNPAADWAKAELAAAAPQLLEALEAYVLAVAVGGGADKASVMAAIRAADDKARAAIAAARGQA